MEMIEGLTYFKEVEPGEKHRIFVKIGRGLDKCRECPVMAQVGASYCTTYEREEMCGSCPNYLDMQELASQLSNYDLTKRQRNLLNKTEETITGSEVEELFYSGVPKKTIAHAMGFMQKNLRRFEHFLIIKGANIPKNYKPSLAEQQKFQTMNLKE